MMPEAKETRVCQYCRLVILHSHIRKCPQCGGTEFYDLPALIEAQEERSKVHGARHKVTQ